MSCTSDRFAVVLSDPGKACDRDTLCPAWSSADLEMGRQYIYHTYRSRKTNAAWSRLGERQWKEPATLDGVK